jgi:hypothetical protein
MSQQVRIERDLVFTGAAAYTPNIKGIPMVEKKIFDETFISDASEHDWTEEEDNGTTIAHAAADGGAETITASGTDDDCGELLHTAQWSPYYNCGMEAKVKISQITGTCICVGFVDALTNTNDHVAMELSGANMVNMTNTADACGMVFDTDATTDVWYCVTANNGTEGTPTAATGSLAPEADTYFKIRVQTNSSGDVDFYYNGIPVGHKAAAIAHTATDLLTPYIGFIARSTDAQVCTVSRITVWQDN